MIARIVGGKGDLVAGCVCKHNIDLSTGCPSGNTNGVFTRNSKGICEYCYGKRINYHKFKPKIIDLNLLTKDIEEKKVKILRIGKFADPGYEELRPQILDVLNLCAKQGVRAIVITKLLEYDRKVAELLKTSNSVLHFSLGYDELEQGAYSLGKFNNYRIKEAKKYFHYGVKTYFRLVKDVTQKADRVSFKAFQSKIPIILTPLRFSINALAEKVTGMTILELKKNRFIRISGYLNPNIIHNDFSGIKNICGEIGLQRYCAKCGL